jgi:TRAP-type C4-dicarboxylate transport system permease small subunit
MSAGTRVNGQSTGVVRRGLNGLYDAAAWLAAAFMVALLVMVLLSISGRLLHFHVPGTDAYAGYFMAAAGFLALAHTFQRGEHIRVTLLIATLRGASRRALELWALTAGAVLAGVTAFYSVRLVWQSRLFNDVSTGNDATPLWIPQLGMAVGTTILFVALVDGWWQALRGQRLPEADAATPARNE